MSRHASARHERGFTLLEMLAAIVIMGVAVSIYFQLFSASITLSQQSSKGRTAARVAEEALTAIEMAPNRYDWPRYEEAEPGELIPLPGRGIGSTHMSGVREPSVQPTDERASRVMKSHFGDFTTETYTSMPSPDANHVRVLVVVRWTVGGRGQAFSLTSTLPRSTVEG